MKRITFVIVIATIMVSGCSVILKIPEMEEAIYEDIVIKPPALKYSLLDSLYEIYVANELSPEKWEKYYSDADVSGKEHYEWLKETYDEMSVSMKESLSFIFKRVHLWKLMNKSTKLADESDIDDIVDLYRISWFDLPPLVRIKLPKMLPEFYKEHFKEYFETNKKHFEKLSASLTEKAKEYKNPFEFMEKATGIYLPGDYSCMFYFTFRKVGAFGFTYGNIKISTLQRNVDSIDKLFFTPLHEYGHDFFQTFTKKSDFKELAEKLKDNDDGFYKYWNNDEGLKQSYSWVGFCEENLVEGFAKFLREQYYGATEHNEVYYYDLDFYEYLKEIDFSPDEISLKDASLSFYEGV
ncbi:MAG: hypothetical protein R6U52_01705 [Kosmotogaceae bacterium]